MLTAEDKIEKNEYAKNWYNHLPNDRKNKIKEAGKNKYHTMTKEQREKSKKYLKKYQQEFREK